jgi:hypothetical protein
MKSRRFPLRAFLATQILAIAAVVTDCGLRFAYSGSGPNAFLTNSQSPVAVIHREVPLSVGPLYNDPDVVSDAELSAVLERIVPRFAAENLKPNFVEHALRTWGIDATFRDPAAMSGAQMRDFLTDHGRFVAAWGRDAEPLLIDQPAGVSIRWDDQPGASVHHDHWLASLTEAGVKLHDPVFTPARGNMTFNDVLQQSLRDFRLDEREVEWSAMAFGFWLCPTATWHTAEGREMSFDRIAGRLMRGHGRFGVCSGTHRVYSLAVLLRLDDEHHILSPSVRGEVFAHLQNVRDLMIASQLEAGCWPSNWSDGADAVTQPVDEPDYKRVIATGHHLEWLAIAPRELHPPRERILKAADWIIKTTIETPDDVIASQYTFFSHVGNALALWRGTRPAAFARESGLSE